MAEVPVSRAQCSMSSACALCSTLQLTGAAHDALQTRDHAKLPRWAGRSFGRSRISGAPLRARALCWMMHELCMRSRCAASGTHSRP